MRAKLTHEEFVKKLERINCKIEVIGTYNGINKSIYVKCKICGRQWSASPKRLLDGSGCITCKKRNPPEVFLEKINCTNNDVELVSEYTKSNDKMKFRCRSCGHIWEVIGSSILRGRGCPKCATKRASQKRRHTQKEFEAKLYSINPNIIVVDEYISVNKKINVKCKICGHDWLAVPSNLLFGTGCPVCGKNKSAKSHMLPNSKFISRLNLEENNLCLLSDYKGLTKNIRLKCLTCGYEWERVAYSAQRVSKCPMCSKINSNISKRENFTAQVADIVDVIGEYINVMSKVQVRCKTCGFVWDGLPNNLVRGHGCPECAKVKNGYMHRNTHDEFISKLESTNSNVIVLEKYIKSDTKINVKCKICNHIWHVRPSDLLSGYGCPKCASKRIGDSLKKSQEDFEKEMLDISPNISVIGKYIGCQNPIRVMCKKCGNIWDVTPQSLIIAKSGCPSCSNSKGENKIMNVLDSLGVEYKFQKKFSDLIGVGGGMLSYDFFLPDLKTLIEYQGQQHYRPVEIFGGEEQFKLQQYHDSLKSKYALENGYTLIEIPYTKFNNIEQIVKDNLKTIEERRSLNE